MILAALCLACAACGSSSSGGMPPVPAAYALNHPDTATMGAVKVQTRDIGCGGHLVLRDPGAHFAAATRQQVQAYMATFGKLTDFATTITPAEQTLGDAAFKFTPWYEPQLPALPAALAWVPGASACFGRIKLTNSGTAPVQVSRAGVALAAVPAPNTFAYNVTDICSLAQSAGCPPAPTKAVAPQCFYYVNLILHATQPGAQSIGNVVANTPRDSYGGTCPTPLTIAPGKTVEILLKLTSAQGAMLDSVAPLVQMSDSATPAQIPVEAWQLVFTSTTTQRTCYALTGDHFVSVANPSARQKCV